MKTLGTRRGIGLSLVARPTLIEIHPPPLWGPRASPAGKQVHKLTCTEDWNASWLLAESCAYWVGRWCCRPYCLRKRGRGRALTDRSGCAEDGDSRMDGAPSAHSRILVFSSSGVVGEF